MGFLEPSVVLQPQLRSATIRELETHSIQSLLKNPCLYYPGRPCWTEVCKEGPDLQPSSRSSSSPPQKEAGENLA